MQNSRMRGRGKRVYRMHKNGEKHVFTFPKIISAACISLLCYSTMSKLSNSLLSRILEDKQAKSQSSCTNSF